MHKDFDPRIWNLFVGVALVSAGCGSRLAGEDSSESGETADTTPEGPEGSEAPECTSSNDCPVGYGCYDGVCMYYPHHDGWVPYYDCYSDSECAQFEICSFGYCELLGEPPPDCGLELAAMAIPINGEASALTFADIDADGQDELVIATEQSLVVHDSNGGPGMPSPRAPGEIAAMVAGDFDMSPGEDVVLLIDDQFVVHVANGDGSFTSQAPEPIALGFTKGLISADFDGQAPTDLLAWGGTGAFIDHGDDVLMLDGQQIAAAAAYELGSEWPSLALMHGSNYDVYHLDGQPITSITNLGDGPPTIVALTYDGEIGFGTIVHYGGWSRVIVHGAATGLLVGEWSIDDTPEQLFAGDLDGDGFDDLVLLGEDEPTLGIEFNPQGVNDCVTTPSTPGPGPWTRAAFGDYDGDGDEELGLLASNGEVALLDGG